MFKRKQQKNDMDYAFNLNLYFFEEMNTTLPWARVKYSMS